MEGTFELDFISVATMAQAMIPKRRAGSVLNSKDVCRIIV